MKIDFRQLLGRNKKEDDRVEEKREERHVILNQATCDIGAVQESIDTLKKHNSKELEKMNKKLENITYKIAVATGGIRIK